MEVGQQDKRDILRGNPFACQPGKQLAGAGLEATESGVDEDQVATGFDEEIQAASDEGATGLSSLGHRVRQCTRRGVDGNELRRHPILAVVDRAQGDGPDRLAVDPGRGGRSTGRRFLGSGASPEGAGSECQSQPAPGEATQDNAAREVLPNRFGQTLGVDRGGAMVHRFPSLNGSDQWRGPTDDIGD